MIFCTKISSIKAFYIFLVVIARNAEKTQNCKSVISLQYLKKEGKDESDFFCMQIKWPTVLQVDTINLGGHGQAMDAQITQSNKFAKALQYLKEVRDEVNFYCNEHHNFF